jgi:hypothetical protein
MRRFSCQGFPINPEETVMTNDRTFDKPADASKKSELTEAQLDTVSGGAPRDLASGLPTGKRMHKPF